MDGGRWSVNCFPRGGVSKQNFFKYNIVSHFIFCALARQTVLCSLRCQSRFLVT